MENQDIVSTISSPWASEMESITTRRTKKKNNEEVTRKMVKGRRRIKIDENTDMKIKVETPTQLQKGRNSAVLTERNSTDSELTIQDKSNDPHESLPVLNKISSKRITRSKLVNDADTPELSKRRLSNGTKAFLNKFSEADDSLMLDNSSNVLNYDSPSILERSRKRWSKPITLTDLIKNEPSFERSRRKTLRSCASENTKKSHRNLKSNVEVDEIEKNTQKTDKRKSTSIFKAFAESLSEDGSEQEIQISKSQKQKKISKSKNRKLKISKSVKENGQSTVENDEAALNNTFELETEVCNQKSVKANRKKHKKLSASKINLDDGEKTSLNRTFEMETADILTVAENQDNIPERKTNSDKKVTVKRNTRKSKRNIETENVTKEKEVKNHTFEIEENVINKLEESKVNNSTFEIETAAYCNTDNTSEIDNNSGIESCSEGEKGSKKRNTYEIDANTVIQENTVAEVPFPANSITKRRRLRGSYGTGFQMPSPWKNDKVVTDDSAPVKDISIQQPKLSAILEKLQNKSSQLKKSASKVPNYTKIHQKAFDKMESLEDYMERKKARAQALLSGSKVKVGIIKPTPSKTPKIMKELFPISAKKLQASTLSTSKATPSKTLSIVKPLFSDQIKNVKATPGKTPNIMKTLFQNKANEKLFASTPNQNANLSVNSSVHNQKSLLNLSKPKNKSTLNLSNNKNSSTLNNKLKSLKEYDVKHNKSSECKVQSKIPLKIKNSVETKKIVKKVSPVKDSKLPVKNSRVEMAKSYMSKTRSKMNDPVKDKREFIKGVRSNRRFDLLMSMRNMN